MNIRAIVFDLDGTLVDSKINFEGMKEELRLGPDSDVLAHVETLMPIEREKALEVIHRYELEGIKTSIEIPGALDFLRSVRAVGLPCAIFTRNARALTHECMRMYGLEIDVVVAREDGPPKPKPDGLFKIAESLSLRVDEMLFVGDYLYDLQAGLAAGTPTALFLPTPPDFDITGASFTFEKYNQLMERVLNR